MTWTLPGAVLFLLGLLLLLGYFLSRKVFPGGSEEEEAASTHGPDCEGCGQAGCGGFAKALIRGGQDGALVPAGETSSGYPASCPTCESPEGQQEKKAFVRCQGKQSARRYHYTGARSCRAAASMQPPPRLCVDACLGFGDCGHACSARAIDIIEGIARVDAERCNGCGDCIKACPTNLLELIPARNSLGVACQRPHKEEGSS